MICDPTMYWLRMKAFNEYLNDKSKPYQLESEYWGRLERTHIEQRVFNKTEPLWE